MRRLLLPVPLLFALAACPKPAPEGGKNLLSQVKAGLAERDAKVSSYRLVGATREQGLEAGFEFSYRAPNKMRGQLTRPQRRTFSFDGAKLFDLQQDEKRFTAYEMKLPPEKSALFLTQTFSPFASEGYRVPLLLREGVTVTRTAHPKAPEAVEVKMETKDEAGQTLSVVYHLRWPALDFLGKRSETGGQVVEVRVDEEHCEEALKMCFPKKLTQWDGKNPIATTVLSKVEINPQIPAGEFTLSAPEGFDAKDQQLVEQGK